MLCCVNSYSADFSSLPLACAFGISCTNSIHKFYSQILFTTWALILGSASFFFFFFFFFSFFFAMHTWLTVTMVPFLSPLHSSGCYWPYCQGCKWWGLSFHWLFVLCNYCMLSTDLRLILSPPFYLFSPPMLPPLLPCSFPLLRPHHPLPPPPPPSTSPSPILSQAKVTHSVV